MEQIVASVGNFVFYKVLEIGHSNVSLLKSSNN